MKQQITKNAIQSSFLKLLSEKPFNKITVRDIVDECGLTRNTFYYYYEDVYEIVDEIVCEGIDRAIEMIDNGSSVLDITLHAVNVSRENKKSLRNILKSPHAEELVGYFDRAVDIVVDRFVINAANGVNISDADRRIIRNTHVYVLRGIFFDWIRSDMKSPIEEDLQRINVIFSGSIESAVKKTSDK